MDCIFCKIIAGDIPCYEIAQSENAIAFLDVMPASQGHILVLPKQHIEFFYDITPEVTADIMNLITKISKVVIKICQADGVNLVVNAGESAGQIVPHAHFHIIPRKQADQISLDWQAGTLEKDFALELVKLIKKELA